MPQPRCLRPPDGCSVDTFVLAWHSVLPGWVRPSPEVLGSAVRWELHPQAPGGRTGCSQGHGPSVNLECQCPLCPLVCWPLLEVWTPAGLDMVCLVDLWSRSAYPDACSGERSQLLAAVGLRRGRCVWWVGWGPAVGALTLGLGLGG